MRKLIFVLATVVFMSTFTSCKTTSFSSNDIEFASTLKESKKEHIVEKILNTELKTEIVTP